MHKAALLTEVLGTLRTNSWAQSCTTYRRPQAMQVQHSSPHVLAASEQLSTESNFLCSMILLWSKSCHTQAHSPYSVIPYAVLNPSTWIQLK